MLEFAWTTMKAWTIASQWILQVLPNFGMYYFLFGFYYGRLSHIHHYYFFFYFLVSQMINKDFTHDEEAYKALDQLLVWQGIGQGVSLASKGELNDLLKDKRWFDLMVIYKTFKLFLQKWAWQLSSNPMLDEGEEITSDTREQEEQVNNNSNKETLWKVCCVEGGGRVRGWGRRTSHREILDIDIGFTHYYCSKDTRDFLVVGHYKLWWMLWTLFVSCTCKWHVCASGKMVLPLVHDMYLDHLLHYIDQMFPSTL